VINNFERWLDIIIQNHGAICVSHNTANDLKRWIDKNRPQCRDDFEINVSHNGADINENNNNDNLTKKEQITLDLIAKRDTFLMVGTLEPRKGQIQTIKAFDILWSNGINVNLVIVGKEGWAIEELIEMIEHHPEKKKRLFWLNSISDLYLEQLYKISSALILSSQGEGFGLPLIEAAQHNLPIIARDIPVFREVAKEYAYYFKDSKEPQVIADSIKEWMELYNYNNHPKSDDMPWLTWRESSENLLSILMKEKNETN
jgi:glycosyltransferase involved in cell wall biosynthesis